jgi:hypothetical protein
VGEHRTLGGFFTVGHGKKVISAESIAGLPQTPKGKAKLIITTSGTAAHHRASIGSRTSRQGRAIMSETAEPTTIVTTGEGQPEFSQKYSKGELEEMASRELLDGYGE